MLVHPAFDVATRTWFLDDGTEAGSISALLAKMPAGTRAKDYHPGGYVVSAEDRGFSVNDLRFAAEAKLRLQVSGAAWAPKQAGHVNRRVINPRNSKYDHEAVLNMWSTGTSGTLISRRLGISKTAVQYVVSCGRVRKDVRAVRRGGVRKEALYA